MKTALIACSLALCALTIAAPASAQLATVNPGDPIRAADINNLVNALNTLTARVDKLQSGQVDQADLVGTYNLTSLNANLTGGTPASVATFGILGTATLAANGTGTIHLALEGNELIQGNPWTVVPASFTDNPSITWSYAAGVLHVTDGEEINFDFNVAAGGRVMTFAGRTDPDDDEVGLIILTRQ
jgi:hypothetical protein